MTDHNLPPLHQASAPAGSRRARRHRITATIAAAVVAGAVGIGAFSTTSFSQGYGFFHPFGQGGGPGFGPGWHRGPFGGTFDPAQAEQRADRMVRHLSIELDATAEQQDKLRTIVKGVVKDVLPMRESMRDARRRVRDLLTAPTIDRAALEKLRADQIALAETFSKRITQALADAADVLTPDQRRKLAERMPPAGFWRG